MTDDIVEDAIERAVRLPIAFNKETEAERSVPITDEDVARGYLEQGWVVTMNGGGEMIGAQQRAAARPFTFLQRTWYVYPSGNARWWVIDKTGLSIIGHRAQKARIAEEDLETVSVPRSVLQPGMVVVQGLMSLVVGEFLWAPEYRLVGTLWCAQTTGDDEARLLCRQRPSVQFILK